jgi:hypothetical protein
MAKVAFLADTGNQALLRRVRHIQDDAPLEETSHSSLPLGAYSKWKMLLTYGSAKTTRTQRLDTGNRKP